MVTDFKQLFKHLADHDVDFVVIGGLALVLRGSSRVTNDLDICYDRRPENLRRLSAALLPLQPTLRGAPATLLFTLDAATIASGLNFTLSTTDGDIDLLGEVSGLGYYDVAARLSSEMEVYGRLVKVLSFDGLERAKRAAGRLKDVMDLADIIELRRQTEKREE